MNWILRVSDEAQAFIDGLPPKTRRQVYRSVDQLREDPFRGNVKPLYGPAWKGFYRKRVGDLRIIFFPHRTERTVDVAAILRRSEKTYR